MARDTCNCGRKFDDFVKRELKKGMGQTSPTLVLEGYCEACDKWDLAE